SILIAHSIEELTDRPDEKISKVNASINIACGLMGISAVIYSLYSAKVALYDTNETLKIVLAISRFLFWSVIGAGALF
ncbi:4-amino-4-deoxy-L-arabinose lipid A transferase, partial [Proteus mirabilis]|nr:4-amino-4-deoxy-L-arabinose lipid A transferase [Proteus mirabilis]